MDWTNNRAKEILEKHFLHLKEIDFSFNINEYRYMKYLNNILEDGLEKYFYYLKEQNFEENSDEWKFIKFIEKFYEKDLIDFLESKSRTGKYDR